MPDRECAICGASFTPRRKVDKTCSLDCQVEHRRKLSREKARRHYKPRPLRPDGECEICKVSLPAPKSGRIPRWCRKCLADREVARGHARSAGLFRKCHKCQRPLPGEAGKPGLAVCDDCRNERSRGERRRAYERTRSLRKYGLTQEQYDELLASQGGRCAGCGTGKPGARGWNIDHCHKSGRVRALLCHRCNTVAGLANEDPAVLRSLADWLERQTALSEIKI